MNVHVVDLFCFVDVFVCKELLVILLLQCCD